MLRGHSALFSDEATRVMRRARDEADQRAYTVTGTEHLLLAMLAERESVAARVLAEAEVNLAAAEVQLRWLVADWDHDPGRPPGLTARAKRVIERMMTRTDWPAVSTITSGHLLAGLLNVYAADWDGGMLARLDVDAAAVRAVLARRMAQPERSVMRPM